MNVSSEEIRAYFFTCMKSRGLLLGKWGSVAFEVDDF
jgi:hypothetical protein